MNSINLLPTDFKVNKDVVHIAQILSRLAIVAGVILLVGGAVGGGIFLFLQNRAVESENTRNNLRSQIEGLETTEQKFILIKDRIAKSQGILSQRGNFKTFENYLELVRALPPGSTFVEEEIDLSISKITLNIADSATVASIIELVESDSKFVRANIESLNFDPIKGYELILNIF